MVAIAMYKGGVLCFCASLAGSGVFQQLSSPQSVLLDDFIVADFGS
jgi:hypothetical protein